MARVVTVTANAALDWTCFVAGLRPGARHAVRASHRQAGGKGANVARVLAGLGETVRSVVVVGGATGEEILRDLERSGLAPIAVRTPGESRTCLELIDEESGATTQLHETGVAANAETARELVAAVEGALAGAEWLALCGSLAVGLPPECYATLIRSARARGVRVALDTSGEALRHGLEAEPDLLRINRDEAKAVGPIEAGRVPYGVISDGSGEIDAWSPRSRWSATPPRVRARNAIGCGDTMLAGLLVRVGRTSFAEALRYATALASAAAERDVVGGAIEGGVQALLDAVVVRKEA